MLGFLVIGVSWTFGARYLIAPDYRLNMAAVAVDIIHDPNDNSGYLVSLWLPMIADGYPFGFTMAVLPAVLLFGAVIGKAMRNLVQQPGAGRCRLARGRRHRHGVDGVNGGAILGQ